MRLSSLRKGALALLALALGGVAMPVLTAAPAAALDTPFTVVNNTDQVITLTDARNSTGGSFAAPKPRIGYKVYPSYTDTWAVQFNLAQSNEAWVSYRLQDAGSTSTVLISATPGYGPAFPPKGGCTVWNDTVNGIDYRYRCTLTGTTFTITELPPTTFQVLNGVSATDAGGVTLIAATAPAGGTFGQPLPQIGKVVGLFGADTWGLIYGGSGDAKLSYAWKSPWEGGMQAHLWARVTPENTAAGGCTIIVTRTGRPSELTACVFDPATATFQLRWR